MVSFEIFVKAMPPCLSELKVLPSFCFAFKIPEDVAASNMYIAQAGAQHSLKASQLARRNLNHTLGSAESKVGILARASYRALEDLPSVTTKILLRHLGTLKCFKQNE